MINKNISDKYKKKSLNSHTKKNHLKNFLIIFLMCVKNWKSRVSEWEKNRNWKINKLCAFRLYLNKVIKLNYFHLLIITQQQQQQHYSKWAKFLLSLCNIYDVIFFGWEKKHFFYSILKLIINGFISSHIWRA